jgi:hypothetical protein
MADHALCNCICSSAEYFQALRLKEEHVLSHFCIAACIGLQPNLDLPQMTVKQTCQCLIA